jgi:hypothetical protein
MYEACPRRVEIQWGRGCLIKSRRDGEKGKREVNHRVKLREEKNS